MLEKSLRNAKSRRILEKGAYVCLGWYDFPNGAKWLARYRGKLYLIIHDGTGNQFFHSHAPEEVSETEAKKLLLESFDNEIELKEYAEHLDLDLSDEEIDRALGLA